MRRTSIAVLVLLAAISLIGCSDDTSSDHGASSRGGASSQAGAGSRGGASSQAGASSLTGADSEAGTRNEAATTNAAGDTALGGATNQAGASSQAGTINQPGANNAAGASSQAGTSGDDSSEWVPLPLVTPASYTRGVVDQLVASKLIDATGGTIEGTVGSPIEGVVVTVPAGALIATTTFSLGYNVGGSFQNLDFNPSPYVLVINTDGQHEFAQPLTVTYPYAHPTNIPVPYYISPDGAFNPITPVPLDRANGRGGFVTWHASEYLFVDGVWQEMDRSLLKGDTGFSPPRDGLRFKNDADGEYAPQGRCLGISSFTKWYWESYGRGLYGKFGAVVPNDASGARPSLTGEGVLATRAHTAVQLANLAATAPENTNLEVLSKVMTDIRTTGRPQIIGISKMMHTSNPAEPPYTFSGQDAMLAFAFDEKRIWVYDSNVPGAWKGIKYKIDTNPGAKPGATVSAAIEYDGDQDTVNAIDVVNPSERFQAILTDAQAGFHDQSQTLIDITSHTDGDTVSDANVTVAGKIQSGQVLIDEADVWVEWKDGTQSARKTAKVSQDNKDFSVDLQMKEGANSIRFETRGRLYLNNGAAKVIKNAFKQNQNLFRLTYHDKYKGSVTVSVSGPIPWTGTGKVSLTPIRDGEFAIAGTVTPDAGMLPPCTVINPEQSFASQGTLHFLEDPPTLYWMIPPMRWSLDCGSTAPLKDMLTLSWSSSCGSDPSNQGLDWAPLDKSVYPSKLKGTLTLPCPNTPTALPGAMTTTVSWDFNAP